MTVAYVMNKMTAPPRRATSAAAWRIYAAYEGLEG